MTGALPGPLALAALAALALGAGLVAAGRWQRRHGGPSGDRIELVTSRYLGGKKVLTVVEVEGARLLLALTGDDVRLVTRLAPRAPASPAGSTEPPGAERPAGGVRGHRSSAGAERRAAHGAPGSTEPRA